MVPAERISIVELSWDLRAKMNSNKLGRGRKQFAAYAGIKIRRQFHPYNVEISEAHIYIYVDLYLYVLILAHTFYYLLYHISIYMFLCVIRHLSILY